MEKSYTLEQLRQVKGIGTKTIERIKEQFDDSDYISEYNSSIHIEPNSLINGDMLEVMNGIPDKSVDMILTDLPYGTTDCSWDTVIDFDKLWKQYNRVIKDNGAIVLFGSEPFSTRLRMSNIDNYKYDWVWDKVVGRGFQVAKHRPMQQHENIIVFNCVGNYFPIMEKRKRLKKSKLYSGSQSSPLKYNDNKERTYSHRYPKSIKTYSNASQLNKKHPTQKPIELLEYLIKTYTHEGELVLDSTMGSGSTCVAAKNLNREYIGIELDEEYFNIAKQRVEEE